MKATIIGASGFAGEAITRELRSRNHETVGIARHEPVSETPADEFVVADVRDQGALAAAASGSDALVLATPPVFEGTTLTDLLPGLLETATRLGTRLAIVGGAASLLTESGNRLLDEPTFPEAWRPGALAHADALEALRDCDTDVDWFVLSPSQFFGRTRPGERRGTYRLGKDELLTDENGESHIGIEDYAAALVDELERPAHHRERFTVGY